MPVALIGKAYNFSCMRVEPKSKGMLAAAAAAPGVSAEPVAADVALQG
jgi:hypothetical protein